jgi:hypothetical protein
MTECFASFQEVFDEPIPYLIPFRDTVEQRAILGLTAGFLLESQFRAVGSAARVIEEDDCWWSTFDDTWFWAPEKFRLREQLKCTAVGLNDYASYIATARALRDRTEVMWSKRGRWGVLIGEDDVVFIGGPEPFMERLVHVWPGWPPYEGAPSTVPVHEQARFLFRRTEIRERDALLEVLKRTLGSEEAARLMDLYESDLRLE